MSIYQFYGNILKNKCLNVVILDFLIRKHSSYQCIFIDRSSVWKLQNLSRGVLLKGILKNLTAKLIKVHQRYSYTAAPNRPLLVQSQ